MITVDTGSGPGHHHNRIYVAWDNATGNSSSEKNGNNVVLSYSDDARRDVLAPRLGQRELHRQDRRHRSRPVRRAERDAARRVAGLRARRRSPTSRRPTAGTRSRPPHMIAHVAGVRVRPGRASDARRARLSRVWCVRVEPLLLVHGRTFAGTKVFVAKSTDGGVTWPPSKQMPGRRRPVQPVARRRPDGRLGERRLLRHAAPKARRRRSSRWHARRTRARRYARHAVANAPTDETTGAGVNLGNQYGDYEGIAALNGVVRPVGPTGGRT